MRTLHLSTFFLVAACGQGAGQKRTDTPSPNSGDTARTTTTAHCFNIVNGAVSDQEAAVGLVVAAQAGAPKASCTGTFIAPRLMLTAAHCVLGGDDTALYWIPGAAAAVPQAAAGNAAFFAAGKKAQAVVIDATDLETTAAGASAVTAASGFRDAAVLVFDADVAPATLDVATMPVFEGDEVELVGYGLTALPVDGAPVTSDGTMTKRLGQNTVFTGAAIRQAFGDVLLLGGEGADVEQGYAHKLSLAAEGDSGGPLLHDGKIVGVLSSGGRDATGTGFSQYVGQRFAYNIYADAQNAALTALIARAKLVAAGSSGSGSGSGSGSASGSASGGCLDD